jgi:hypothetical protein
MSTMKCRGIICWEVPLPRQLLLRCSTSCIHAVVPHCHRATTRPQGIHLTVALVPKPRVDLTRFHGVFAPNSKYRARVTPAQRGKGQTIESSDDRTPTEHRAAMTWAQRLKRVFNIDIETCSNCGGEVRIIACIEDLAVINQILAHLDQRVASSEVARLPQSRAPPQIGLFKETHQSNRRLQ